MQSTAAASQPELTRSSRNELLQKRVDIFDPVACLKRAVHPSVSQHEKARVEVGPVCDGPQQSHFGDAAPRHAVVAAR